MPRSKERNEKESTKERDKKESVAPASHTLYPPSTRLREDMILRGADVLKMSHNEARAWIRYMDENGWRFKAQMGFGVD